MLRIKDLHVAADHRSLSMSCSHSSPRSRSPSELAHALLALQPEDLARRAVQVIHPPVQIGDDHALVDGVEDRLEETLLIRQPQQIALHLLRAHAADAFDEFVEKAGVHADGRGFRKRARCQKPSPSQLRNPRVKRSLFWRQARTAHFAQLFSRPAATSEDAGVCFFATPLRNSTRTRTSAIPLLLMKTTPKSLTAGAPRILATGIAVLLASLAGTSALRAATLVPLTGTTVTFDALPAATEFSTFSIAGAAATLTTAAQVDTAVQALTASGITTQLGSQAASPIASNALGQFSSTAFNIQTRPTGNNATVVLGTFQNAAGGPINSLALDYDFGSLAPVAESPGLEGHRVYFSPTGLANSWAVIPSVSNIATAGHLSATVSFAQVAPNAPFYLLFADDNGPGGPDAAFSIDNLHLVPTLAPVAGANLVYNLGHTVGGAPNGMLAVSPAPYWLNGSTPAGFANNDSIAFSQNGTATVTVPADVTPFSTTVSAATGTYTIGGAGKIGGPLTKSNTGDLVLTSDNAFTASALSGGLIETRSLNALGTGALTVSGTGGTLQTTVDTNVPGINGDGPLVKTGPGALVVTGASTSTSDLTVSAGNLILDSTTGGTVSSNILFTPNGVTVIGNGTAALGGTQNNTYTGDTVVNGGVLVARKAAGTIAIPGNLVVNVGGTFRYSGNNVSNQINDTSTVTLNGGTFGDPTATAPTNPGATDTFANLIINSGGIFGSGRNLVPGPFTITGVLQINAGSAVAQRGGIITAESVEIGAAGIVNLDGGSTTVSNESRLNVGVSGLTMNSGTINFNTGPSAISATSVGSVVTLNGNVTSSGTSKFVRLNPTAAIAVANVDLGSAVNRTFNILGSLDIGDDTAPINVINGSIVKTGTGELVFGGNATLNSLNIGAGTVRLDTAGFPPPEGVFGEDAGTAALSGPAGQAVPEPGSLSLLAMGALGLLSFRRRSK